MDSLHPQKGKYEMDNFIYNLPTKVYFGPDQLQHLGEEAAKYGKNVLFCYGGGSIKKNGLYDKAMAFLNEAGLHVTELSGIEPNPKIESVYKGAELCKENHIDCVAAVGGGSVIDCAKIIAAAACVDFDPWEFFSKKTPIEKALPVIDVLTLAATGTEMDDCAVISNPETVDKMGAASPALIPKVSFMDPTVTFSVPAYQTAAGSADILNHIMEDYFAPRPNFFMLDRFMEGLMQTVIRYAPIAMEDPENYEARANLMWASSWAINGFNRGANPKIWSMHPIEHQLTANYGITHGHGLAIVTPRYLQYVRNEKTMPRLVEFGVRVWGIDPALSDDEIVDQAIAKTENFLFDQLKLTDNLKAFGVSEDRFDAMAEKACKKGIIHGFVDLGKEDIKAIYQACMEPHA